MAWTAFPYPDDAYVHDAASLKAAWPRLHVGDAEPFPTKPVLVDAWIAFHAGDFEKAMRLGLSTGIDGYSVAHKATCTHANYLEPSEKKQLALFEEVAERCERHQAEQPDNPAGWYWQAYAMGRYFQRISVVKALTHGIGTRVRACLDKTIALAPGHADAHTALGAWHAEIIGSVGAMIAGLTYGARRDACYLAFGRSLELNPASASARIEYANALVILEGRKKMDEALRLYRQAAAIVPQDAKERLEVEAAAAQLKDE
jgi:tetratricopeptide (TPR) repeat protein